MRVARSIRRHKEVISILKLGVLGGKILTYIVNIF